MNKKELTIILQSLENELRITENTDEQDADSKKWAKEVKKVIEKVDYLIKNSFKQAK